MLHPPKTKFQQVASLAQMILRSLLALLLIVAGVMHFVRADFFLKVMPPYFPFPLELVYLSGICEMGLGGLLLIPRFRRFAGWGIVALLIAVFPANIYVYQHQELIPASPTVHFWRLPLQAVLVLIAYWQTGQSVRPGVVNK